MPPSRSARFALDVAPLRARPTGVGVYVRELARALAELETGDMVFVGARDPDFPRSDLRDIPSTGFRRRHYQVWLHRDADGDARRLGAMLIHYTNSAAPLTPRLPYVVTIHDLSLLRAPRSHPPLRVATAPITLAAALRARAILVPSEATRRELARFLPVVARRVVVIPHGASHVRADGVADGSALSRSGLEPNGYVLSIGTLEHRKNQRRLVEAFARVARTRPELRLVLAGHPGWGAAAVLRAVERSQVRERIVVTGYVDDRELAELRAGAAVIAYVSRYEGFGLPVLEGVASGVPVVTSASSAMPEAGLGRATLVDPTHVETIAAGLETALDGERRGPPPLVRSWRDVAAQLHDVYQHVLRTATRRPG